MVRQPYRRADRVGDLVKRELAEILIRGDLNTDFGFVTITQVEMSNDLKHAKVYLSIHGTGEERKTHFATLMEYKKKIRHLLAQRLNLRYTPALKLFLDESLDHAIKVQKLLNNIDGGLQKR